jgi:hypothetical protein
VKLIEQDTHTYTHKMSENFFCSNQAWAGEQLVIIVRQPKARKRKTEALPDLLYFPSVCGHPAKPHQHRTQNMYGSQARVHKNGSTDSYHCWI